MFCSSDFSSPTNDGYYIALRYNDTSSRYEWDIDTPLASGWDNWNPGQDSTTDLCVVANPTNSWMWESVDCSDSKYALCEYGLRKCVSSDQYIKIKGLTWCRKHYQNLVCFEALTNIEIEIDWIEEYQWVDPFRLWEAVSGEGWVPIWSNFPLD